MRRWVRAIACASLAFDLIACAVGPQYKAPTPPKDATAALVANSSQVTNAQEPPDAWWRLYDDQKLDRLIGEALSANADLKVAQASLTGARAIELAARAERLPNTHIAFGVDRGRDSVTDEILKLTGRRPRTFWFYEGMFDVNYEVDVFGRVQHTLDAANAGVEASEAQRDAVRVMVAAETARAYAQICALGEQLGVTRHSLELVTLESEISRKRRDAGAGSEFDVVRSEALIEQVRALLPPLEGQRSSAEFQLAAMLGRTPADVPHDVEACESPPQLKSMLPAGDGASLLRRRPDVRTAERRLAMAVAQIGVATADLYPRFSLSAFYGSVATPWPQFYTVNGQTWGVSPAVEWNFPMQSGARARVLQSEAGAAAALANFDSTVLIALKEASQALAIYSNEVDHHAALIAAQGKVRHAFELAKGQYAAGAVSNLDLLTSEQALVAADAAVSGSDSAIVQDQIAAFKALGGGWQRP